MKVLRSQKDRVLAILEKGPARCAQIASATGLSSASASSVARTLVRDGLVILAGNRARDAIYAVNPEAARPKPYLRGSAYRAAEDTYIAKRKAGATRRSLESAMDLSISTSEVFEGAFRQQTTSGYSADSSCPKFADHDRHIAALANVGAYPVMPTLADLRRHL